MVLGRTTEPRTVAGVVKTLSSTAVTATTTASSGWSYGFQGWSPESDAESETYTVAANNAGTATPDRITNSTTSAHNPRTRG